MNKSQLSGHDRMQIWARLRVAVRFLLILVGILCITLSFILPERSLESAALVSLGVAIVTTTIISFINSLFGTGEDTRLEHIERELTASISTSRDDIDMRMAKFEHMLEHRSLYAAGVDGAYPNYGDAPRLTNISTAHFIDMLHNAGKYDFAGKGYQNDIVTAIREHQCEVRILLSNPDDSIWDIEAINRILAPLQPPTEPIRHLIRQAVEVIRAIIKELEKRPINGAGTLEVRMFTGISTSNLMIIDHNFVRHTPRLMYEHTESSPAYDIVRGRGDDRLFERYKHSFEEVWDRSKAGIVHELCFPHKQL